MDYTMQFSVVWNNVGLFIQGVFLTLQLALTSIAFGLVLGVLGALGRTSGNKILNAIAVAYVEFIRNTPFLIQLFFFFFGLPGIGLRLTPWQASVLALAINFGAYSTEIIRAGIEGIGKGQIEAGMALGLSKLKVFRHVVLMPALGNIYPSLVSQIVIAILFTSVVSQISAEELTFVGNFLQSRTFRSFEIYLTIAFLYLGIVWFVKFLAFLIQQKFFSFMQYIR
ncbi:MAG: amino acid ABC transporter permease [Kaiparowitsia implicata GSE-PSE-MK54-09C]|jgi:polar amino acid transport system permease protein|nr:amino acid ABC transporter permease [Kaiparowitsia implicata GSE-PSE-MK54-09C]